MIVDGPPGSGKSIIAAKLWAALVLDERLPEGSVVFTTTSVSQSSNWERLFMDAGGAGAAGVVKKATSYTPITPKEFGRLRGDSDSTVFKPCTGWRANLAQLRKMNPAFRNGANDNEYLVSIVDEAHALINPEHTDGRGNLGFATPLGPQAYHIMRTSRVSLFLLDSEQSFRDRENTTVGDIRAWAKELGADVHEDISLQGSQFRCAGSKEYVDWVEGLLRGDPPDTLAPLAASWRKHLDLRVVDSLHELEAALREQLGAGMDARLLASYARGWKTKAALSPHSLPGSLQDFHEQDGDRFWSRPWNYVPRGTDYTSFIRAPQGSMMHEDPLSEVGCPYAVRGFDFDYVGLLWLGDLGWQDDRWAVDTDHVFESGLKNALRRARQESDPSGPAHQQLLDSVARGYRVLMTRPMKGVFFWFEDQRTRERVEACLGKVESVKLSGA